MIACNLLLFLKKSPPKDELLYEGPGQGSEPNAFHAAHNLDYAGFLPLLEETYRMYTAANPQMSDCS